MDKKNLRHSLLLFAVLMAVYLLTLSRGVAFEDSGELITAAYTLSAAHPPGYPLYLLLARLFAFLPFPSIAFRVNLMSALFSALSMVLFFNILRKTAGAGKEPVYSLLAALGFGLTTTLWSVSLVSEVYSLNLFFIALLFYLMLLIFQENRAGTHALFFYLLGTALGNHQTAFFLLLLYILLFFREGLYKKAVPGFYAKNALFFLLGSSLALYLPVRSLSGPLLNWGAPSSPGRLAKVLLRSQYGALFSGNFSWNNLTGSLAQANPFYEFSASLPPALRLSDPALLLALIPLLFLLYRGGKALKPTGRILGTGLFLSFTLLLALIVRTPADKLFTLKVFFIPGWMGFFLLLFSGLLSCLKKTALIPLALCPVLLFAHNYGILNKRNDRYAADYAGNILRDTPFRSVLFTLRDNETFPLWYYTLAEGKRPDLAVINIVLLSESWYCAGLAKKHPVLAAALGGSSLPGAENKKKSRGVRIERVIRAHPAGAVRFVSPSFGGYALPSFPLRSLGLLYGPEEKRGIPFSLPEFSNIRDDFARFKKNFPLLPYKDLSSAVRQPDPAARHMLQTVNFSLLDYAKELPDSAASGILVFTLYVNKLIRTDINNILILARLAGMELKQNAFSRAADLYEAASSLQPGTPLSLEMKKTAEKLRRTLSGRTAELYKNAEKAYSRKEYKKAAHYYLSLMREGAENPVLLSGLGDCYFHQEEYGRAMEYYSRAIRLKKDYAAAYYNLGGCALMLGKRDEAVKIWREGLEHAPGDPLLKEALDKH